MALSPASFPLEKVVGQFQHKETGSFFEFKQNSSGLCPDHPYEVFVGPNAESTRCARVGMTVAYVVVDEDEHGNPVEEKWPIKMIWSAQCVRL